MNAQVEKVLTFLNFPKYDDLRSIKIRPIDVLKVTGGLAAGYLFYNTFSIYFVGRKFWHIPGPGTKGYKNKINKILLFTVKTDLFHSISK